LSVRLPADLEFEEGTWYCEASRDMETTIRDGELMEQGGAREEP
jgi:hypothetical protein